MEVDDDPVYSFWKLVSPYTTERFAEVEKSGLKMAHYTTAESAALILKNKKIWLRNASLMNDFSEISYGSACLQQVLNSGVAARLSAAFEKVHPNFIHSVLAALGEMYKITCEQTYLTSLSAHDPNNHLGKLSMWRAYGGSTSGVALIFNTDAFKNDSDTLGAYSCPVLYGDWSRLAEEIERIAINVEQNIELLRAVSFESAKSTLVSVLQYWTLSTKHPAFVEEQEWRVIHSPLTDASAFIPTSVQTVRGIPQMVCEVPLENQPGLEMPWLDLANLLDHIIIGPCVYPDQVAWAFAEILRDIGIPNPYERISIARIPLRQRG